MHNLIKFKNTLIKFDFINNITIDNYQLIPNSSILIQSPIFKIFLVKILSKETLLIFLIVVLQEKISLAFITMI